MLDPISDMLTRIRNATSAGHPEVLIPWSKFKMKIAEVLHKKRIIEKISVEGEEKKTIKIILRYTKDEKSRIIPCLQGLRRISKEGQRIYVGKDKLPRVKSGYGFAIVSTSRGLMTDSEARSAGLGGEIICEVW